MATAYIALGSNLGHAGRTPAGILSAAMQALAGLGSVVARSSLYETAPVGFLEQPAFVNAVAAVETILAAEELLQQLMELERSFGRDRSAGLANGPRTLDLDLLLLDQERLNSERLTLPHPRMAERRFVLQPLVEIAPDLWHPVLKKPMRALLAELPGGGDHRRETVRRLS